MSDKHAPFPIGGKPIGTRFALKVGTTPPSSAYISWAVWATGNIDKITSGSMQADDKFLAMIEQYHQLCRLHPLEPTPPLGLVKYKSRTTFSKSQAAKGGMKWEDHSMMIDNYAAMARAMGITVEIEPG